MVLYFAIVGRNDSPLYQSHLTVPRRATPATSPPAAASSRDDLLSFILHASLDAVDHKIWTTTHAYLHQVDKFNDIIVSAYVTAGNIKLLLLHDSQLMMQQAVNPNSSRHHHTQQQLDDSHIRQFFESIYELYVVYLLHPFHSAQAVIEDKLFDTKVKQTAVKFLAR